jgi:hypothetical protein
MKSTIAALISAAVITPAVGAADTTATPKDTAKIEVPSAKDEMAKGATKVTAKERAKTAKAKKKQSKKQKAPKAS